MVYNFLSATYAAAQTPAGDGRLFTLQKVVKILIWKHFSNLKRLCILCLSLFYASEWKNGTRTPGNGAVALRSARKDHLTITYSRYRNAPVTGKKLWWFMSGAATEATSPSNKDDSKLSRCVSVGFWKRTFFCWSRSRLCKFGEPDNVFYREEEKNVIDKGMHSFIRANWRLHYLVLLYRLTES